MFELNIKYYEVEIWLSRIAEIRPCVFVLPIPFLQNQIRPFALSIPTKICSTFSAFQQYKVCPGTKTSMDTQFVYDVLG